MVDRSASGFMPALLAPSLYGFALEDEEVTHRFHAQDSDFVGNQLRENLMLEASKMRIHDIQGYLDGPWMFEENELRIVWHRTCRKIITWIK